MRFVQAVAAVLSDHQTSAEGVKSAGGIRLAEGVAVGEERQREHERVCRCLGSLDETIRGGHRLLTGTGVHQADKPGMPGCGRESGPRCELGAAPLDPPFGLADVRVHSTEHAVEDVRQHIAALCKNHLGGVAVADAVSIRPVM